MLNIASTFETLFDGLTSVFSVAYLVTIHRHLASKSITSVPSFISKTEAPRTRKMTEKGKPYQLGIKQANCDCALAKLKKQIEKINLMCDLPEATMEQLASERDSIT